MKGSKIFDCLDVVCESVVNSLVSAFAPCRVPMTHYDFDPDVSEDDGYKVVDNCNNEFASVGVGCLWGRCALPLSRS